MNVNNGSVIRNRSTRAERGNMNINATDPAIGDPTKEPALRAGT